MDEKKIKAFDNLVNALGYNRLRSDNMTHNHVILDEVNEILSYWNEQETITQDEDIADGTMEGIIK